MKFRVPTILTTPKIGGVPHHALERCIPKEAYKRLHYLLEREKSKVHGDEVLCLLQREVSVNEPLNESTDKSKHYRQAQIQRLLR